MSKKQHIAINETEHADMKKYAKLKGMTMEGLVLNMWADFKKMELLRR